MEVPRLCQGGCVVSLVVLDSLVSVFAWYIFVLTADLTTKQKAKIIGVRVDEHQIVCGKSPKC